MNTDKELNLLREAYRRDNNLNPPVGVLGKGDSAGTLTDTAVLGNVWVREWTGGSYSTAISVVNALPSGTRIWSGMGIVIGFKNGERAIVDIDRAAIRAAGANPGALSSPYTTQESITPLLVKPTNPPSLSVQVLGANFVVNGITYLLQSTDDTNNPNLTSYVPAAGEHCYACIYLKNDYATFEIFSSTPKNALLPLDESDLDECHAQKTSLSGEVWAVHLHDDQTEIGNDDIYTLGKDLRGLFNVPLAGAVAQSFNLIIMGDNGHPLVSDTGFFILRDA